MLGLGLGLAVILGALIEMVMGVSRLARDGLYPPQVGFNAIPKAPLVPVISLIFIGQQDVSTALMAFIISFFPIAVSVGIGLSTLEPDDCKSLRSLGASRFPIFRKIAQPGTLPEFFGAPFRSCETDGDCPLMFAVLIALAVLGIVLYSGCAGAGAYFCRLGRTSAGIAHRWPGPPAGIFEKGAMQAVVCLLPCCFGNTPGVRGLAPAGAG